MISRIVVYGLLIASILLTPIAYSNQVDKVQGQMFRDNVIYIIGCQHTMLVKADYLSKQNDFFMALTAMQYAFACVFIEMYLEALAQEEASWSLNVKGKLTYQQMWQRFLGKNKFQYMQLES